MSGCCFGSSGFCLFFVKPLLFLRGRCLLWSFEPFTTRPVFGFYLPVFFSCLVFSSTPCSLFLSLSLSGAGETQTFLVWVSPCVLFFLHADYDYDPYFFLITYTQATPSPCFFFPRRRRSFSGLGVSRFGPGGVGCLCGCQLFLRTSKAHALVAALCSGG